VKALLAEDDVTGGIKRWALGVLCALAACAASPVPAPGPVRRDTPDEAVRRVLASYGLSARIVRPWHAVKDSPASGDKGVRILLAGSPGVELVLDRDYWALVITKAGEQSAASWVLNPKDEQSALNISVGEDVHDRSDEKLAEDPGFTQITRHAGTIDGEAVTWRRWSDKNHLYSDCTLWLLAKSDPLKRKHQVSLIVTANTEARRRALEDRLASLQLKFTASSSM